MIKNNISIKSLLLTMLLLYIPFQGLQSQDIVVDSIVFSTGEHLYFSPATLTSPGNVTRPVLITGNAHVEYKANHYVHLSPGFSTSLASGCGSFHASTGEIAILNSSIFIEGFYSGNLMMQPTIFNSGAGSSLTDCDSIIIELHDPLSLVSVMSDTVMLQTNGTFVLNYPSSVLGGIYYISIRHRNAIQTWSKLPVTFGIMTEYDFAR
jgi:hypothetical protein